MSATGAPAGRRPKRAGDGRPAATLPWIVSALAIGCIVATAVLAGAHEIEEVRSKAIAQLSAAAAVEASHVERWREERLSDARRIAGHPSIARAAWRVQERRAEAHDGKDLVEWARSRTLQGEYSGVAVLGLRGEIVASAGLAPEPEHASFLDSSAPDRGALLDLHEDPTGLHADLVAPLLLHDGRPRVVGVVVMRIDPSAGLFPIVNSWTQHGDGSRSFLVRTSTGEVLCSCDRRGRKVGEPRSTYDDPLNRALLLGPTGLSATQPLGDSGWSVAVAADERVFLERIRKRLAWIVTSATALAAFAAAAALLWRRHQLASFEVERREAEGERTARVHAEAALRKSEDRFRAAFFGAGVGTALVDPEGRFIDFNPPFSRMLGYPADELRGRAFRELLHEDDLAGSVESFSKLASGERDHNDMQRRYVRKDGRVVHLRYAVSAIRDPVGKFAGAVAVVEDVTDGVTAQAELERSEERLRLALQATDDGVWDWDVARDEVYLSPRFDRMLGIELPRRARMEHVLALIHPLERADLERLLADFVEGGRSGAELEHRLRHGSGEWTWVLNRAKTVATAQDGSALRVVGACTDVTERRALHAGLLLADRMASLGTLAAGVAHEVNNPLAYVIANLGFAREALSGLASSREMADVMSPLAGAGGKNATLVATLRDAIDDARQGAERVRHIVRDLKTLSRVDDDTAPVDVSAALGAALRVARREIERRARLATQIVQVPPVKANEGRLAQVFLNLIVNAAQAIPEGDPAGNEVGVATGLDAMGRVFVEIRDTGSGIAPDVLGHIFDPFFTTKPAGIGTGLGLAICRRIVSEIGGEIRVETEVGMGSTFRIVLPAMVGLEAESSAARDARA